MFLERIFSSWESVHMENERVEVGKKRRLTKVEVGKKRRLAKVTMVWDETELYHKIMS